MFLFLNDIRKRYQAVLWIVGVLLTMSLCGCSDSGEESFLFYYASNPDKSASIAVSAVERAGDYDAIEPIFRILCQSPENAEMKSALPEGTRLVDWTLSRGNLTMCCSPEYGTLAGVEQTIADACLVLTFTQLKEVHSVSIIIDGDDNADQEVLSPQSFLLQSGEGNVVAIHPRLYFPTDSNGIGFESRELTVEDGQKTVYQILNALCAGPEHSGMHAYLPENCEQITIWVDSGICYVNLTEEWVTYLEESSDGLAVDLRCLTNSLSAQNGVEKVQFLLDGATIDRWASAGGDFPLEPDISSCIQLDTE